ncbi:MAG: CopG family transcriptional regulator [bacterium]|nr:CopG family transcriptional regulator [bacterium]
MKTLEVALPDRLAKQVKQLVEQGWFLDEAEVARQALSEFLSQHRFELQEQFQRDDIRWASSLKEGGA